MAAAIGTFLVSAVVFGAIWHTVICRVKTKAYYYEYKHGEVRKWNE